MSKTSHRGKSQPPMRFGDWVRELRAARDLPLRAVAEAAGMDLAHLQKIEQGFRIATEEQAAALARFFKVDAMTMQARRIAEKFRQEFGDSPAAGTAISILAEEARPYRVRKG